MTSDPLLRVQLDADYAGRAILHNVCLELNSGEVLGLVGSSGAGKNRDEVESFLVLGFGGRGHDLAKLFDVSFQGYEEVGGVRAAKLDLVPKTAKGKSIFDHIVLWIDTTEGSRTRGVSVQQQFFEPQGDYRLARYSNIKLNQNIPNDVFKLKTTGRTKVINPQGSF